MHSIQSIGIQGHPTWTWHTLTRAKFEFQDADLQWSADVTRNVFGVYDEDDEDAPAYDPEGIDFNNFTTPKNAQAVRIYPLSFNYSPTMRFEIYGRLKGRERASGLMFISLVSGV